VLNTMIDQACVKQIWGNEKALLLVIYDRIIRGKNIKDRSSLSLSTSDNTTKCGTLSVALEQILKDQEYSKMYCYSDEEVKVFFTAIMKMLKTSITITMPPSLCHCFMLVLSSLLARESFMSSFIEADGLKSLLQLKIPAFKGVTSLFSLIVRRCMETEVMLRLSMMHCIRDMKVHADADSTTTNSNTSNASNGNHGSMKLDKFLQATGGMLTRHPEAYVRAVLATVEIKKPHGEGAIVTWLPSKASFTLAEESGITLEEGKQNVLHIQSVLSTLIEHAWTCLMA